MTANPPASDRFYAGIGSRKIDDLGKRRVLAVARALRRWGWTCRSGHAPGSDQAWEEGAGEHAEVYKPWRSFEAAVPVLARVVYDKPTPLAYEIASLHHPAWLHMRHGARSLHARNTHQILGRDCKTPSLMVCCWTPGGEMVGGTAQALRLAAARSIKIFNFASEDHVFDFQSRFGIELGALERLQCNFVLPDEAQ